MNKQDRNTANRIMKALGNLDVTVKRSQAYDLLAAARGLRNRELLKQEYVVPDDANTAMLERVATSICPDEAERVVVCISAVAFPTMLTCVLDNSWTEVSFTISFDELSDPDAFLSGPRASEALKTISRNMYHSRYYLDRSDGGLDLKRGNKLAEKLLATSEQCDRYEALEEVYGEPRQAYETLSEHDDDVEGALDALDSLANEVGADFDADDWREPLEQALLNHLEEDDDSSVKDMIQGSDRAELVFAFAMKGGHPNDRMVTCEWNSSDPTDVNLDLNFQFALSRLGYSIGEYRRFTGSKRDACSDLSNSIKPKARTLVTPGELTSVIANAGDSYFHLGLYLQVTIKEILELDLSRPIVLRKARLCAYGPINGTHYDEVMLEEVVLSPDDGILMAATSSPSDMCGYVNSYFHGTLENMPEAESGAEANASTVSDLDQYRMAFAA